MRYKKNRLLNSGIFGLVVFFIFSVFLLHFISIDNVNASEQQYCDEDITAYYDARLVVSPDEYDVYVKLGKRGQATKVQLLIEDDTNCKTIGKVQANGETYKKIGTWKLNARQEPRFILAADIFDSMPDANRPEVLLVSKSNPVCIPDKKCSTKIGDEKGYVVPIHTSLAVNDLVVKNVTDPKNDQITKVDYYANNRYLYTTPKVEDFNTKLVPGGNQTLSKVISYRSGQKVVIDNQVYISFTKDFSNLLFRIFNSNKTWLKIVGSILLFAVLISIILAIFRIFRRRRQWKINHGILQEQSIVIPDDPDVQQQPIMVNQPIQTSDNQVNESIERILRLALPIVGVIAFVLFSMIVIDNYFVEIFRVDGVSMEKTLYTDDRLAVNKSPSTWANINGQKYLPRRGEVIIFTKPANILSDEQEKIQYVVKRVIGLPGERVFINGGTITIYNAESPKGFNPDKGNYWEKTYIKGDENNLDITLAENEIFVSGDNRPESLDSRTNGPIDIQYIIGRVDARVLPFKDRQKL